MRPRNIQAILDWTREHRPDVFAKIKSAFDGDGPTGHPGVSDTFMALLGIGFEAGRTFQSQFSNWPLNQPHLYDPEVAPPEPAPTGYEDLVAALTNLPLTFIPAILATIVQEAERKPVFNPGQLIEFVKRVQAKARSGA